jgi:hypothetical protein
MDLTKHLDKVITINLRGAANARTRSVDLRENILDPVSKKPRQIHYAPGESSVFVDEQSMDVRNVKSFIVFKYGLFSFVPMEDMNLYMYFSKSIEAKKDKSNFFVVDVTSKMEEHLQKEGLRTKAEGIFFAKIANQKGREEIKKAASLYGINVGNDSQAFAILLEAIKKEPLKFIEMIENPYIEKKFTLNEFINADVFVLDEKRGLLFWGERGMPSKKHLVKVPNDVEDKLQYITELFETEKELKEILEQAEKLI